MISALFRAHFARSLGTQQIVTFTVVESTVELPFQMPKIEVCVDIDKDDFEEMNYFMTFGLDFAEVLKDKKKKVSRKSGANAVPIFVINDITDLTNHTEKFTSMQWESRGE